MIVLHHFQEAHQLYRQERILFRLLQDQAAVLIGVCQAKHPGVADPLDITKADIDWLLQQPEVSADYADMLGGYVHICESEEDLLQVQGCDMEFGEQHGRWPNVTEMPLGWDSCAYLEESSGQPQWALFLLCWSDSGGPVYYVPKHLWQSARVEEHMNLTNFAWNS